MNELNEIQIKSILKRHGYSINGVNSKDQIPLVLNPGWYVINLEDHDKGKGTHWFVIGMEKPYQNILIRLEYHRQMKF